MWTKLRFISIYLSFVSSVPVAHEGTKGVCGHCKFTFLFVEILESCLHNSGQGKKQISKRQKRFLNDETAKLKKEHCDFSITTTECYMINDDTLCMY